MTGNGLPIVQPMLNYFKPLFDVIDSELFAAGESPCFGGKSSHKCNSNTGFDVAYVFK